MMKFTKEDLKDGMVVEIKKGNKYLVIGDRLVRNDGYLFLSNYDDNMVHCCSDEYTVVKICKVTNNFVFSDLLICKNLTLIWEREEITEEQQKVIELEKTIELAQNTISEAVCQIHELKR